ncbi:MAG: hypothetical protein WCR42_01815 [bacterium]
MGRDENKIRNSLVKRLEALEKHNARKKEFFIQKERIEQDIEEARNIWISTMNQLPKKEF